MSESEANAVAECEQLEQAWTEAKNIAVEKQELMLLAIKTHLCGAGPAPSRQDYQSLEDLWHQEHITRDALDDFISHVIG